MEEILDGDEPNQRALLQVQWLAIFFFWSQNGRKELFIIIIILFYFYVVMAPMVMRGIENVEIDIYEKPAEKPHMIWDLLFVWKITTQNLSNCIRIYF